MYTVNPPSSPRSLFESSIINERAYNESDFKKQMQEQPTHSLRQSQFYEEAHFQMNSILDTPLRDHQWVFHNEDYEIVSGKASLMSQNTNITHPSYPNSDFSPSIHSHEKRKESLDQHKLYNPPSANFPIPVSTIPPSVPQVLDASFSKAPTEYTILSPQLNDSKTVTTSEKTPLYVNPKQYYRILKRRISRTRFDTENWLSDGSNRPYINDSRRQHALQRERGPEGRFLAARKNVINEAT
jgi:hypothetical protein